MRGIFIACCARAVSAHATAAPPNKAAKLLTRDEARRIALNIAKLLAAEAFGLFFKQWKIRAHLDDAPNRRVTVCRSIQREE
jgi:hypothetical protein